MLGKIDFVAESGSENPDFNPEICNCSPARDGQRAKTGQLAFMGLLTSKGQKKWMEPEQESLSTSTAASEREWCITVAWKSSIVCQHHLCFLR